MPIRWRWWFYHPIYLLSHRYLFCTKNLFRGVSCRPDFHSQGYHLTFLKYKGIFYIILCCGHYFEEFKLVNLPVINRPLRSALPSFKKFSGRPFSTLAIVRKTTAFLLSPFHSISTMSRFIPQRKRCFFPSIGITKEEYVSGNWAKNTFIIWMLINWFHE